jgi:hypothetical protein
MRSRVRLAADPDRGAVLAPVPSKVGGVATILREDRMLKPSDTILEVEYIAVHPDGSESPLFIRIGRPYLVSVDEWACGLGMAGIYDDLADAHGSDALQALGLAMALLRRLLDGFVERGGRILFKTEREDVPLRATFGDNRRSEESA